MIYNNTLVSCGAVFHISTISYHMVCCVLLVSDVRVSHFYNISHNVVKTSHVYSKNITYISKYICMYKCLSI